jgi:type I restriction enzyme S subunit
MCITIAANIAETAVLTFPACFPDSVVGFIPDDSRCCVRFVEYMFRFLKRRIQHEASGSVQDNINLATLERLHFLVPELAEQRAIAHILGTLDDKIELNRRLNETLEATARAIFKSWFVDFDPVRAKAEGRRPHGMDKATADLFPSEFEDSTLGKVPKGWRVTNIGSLLGTVIGGDWGKDEPDADFSEAILCIRGADIPSLQSGGVGKMPVRYVKRSSLEKRRLQPEDLAFEISGGSPTQSTGRPVLITRELVQRVRHPITCSNFCRLIRPDGSCCSYFLYLLLRYLYHSDEFLQFENGTTGIKNFAFTVFCDRYDVVVPTLEAQRAFRKLVAPLFAIHSNNGLHTETLAGLRDALLPKLLSGEIRVGEAI